MELFDKLGDTIVSVSKDATQKAKDISDLARIRMEIHAKQDYINKLYLEIGKLYYEAHKDDEKKEFEDQMTLLAEAGEALDNLKQQLGQIKGTVRCMQCGQDMPLEADYCSKCGTKLVKPKKEEESSASEEASAGPVQEDISEEASAGPVQEEINKEVKVDIEITQESKEDTSDLP